MSTFPCQQSRRGRETRSHYRSCCGRSKCAGVRVVELGTGIVSSAGDEYLPVDSTNVTAGPPSSWSYCRCGGMFRRSGRIARLACRSDRPWLIGLTPPAMSTIPLFNNVAVLLYPVTVMVPVTSNVPATGSYSSALISGVPVPAMSTFPFCNNVAVWPSRARVMLPVCANAPAFWVV